MFIERSYVQEHLHNTSSGLQFTFSDELIRELEQSTVDVTTLIRGSGFGVCLKQHGQISTVAASSAMLTQVNPNHFYTQQTLDNARVTEIMMPFGMVGQYALPENFKITIHYFIGMPIFLHTGECVGCIFAISDKHASLSEKEKTMLQIIAQNIGLKLDVAASEKTEILHQETFQFLFNHFEEAVFIKNERFEIVFANEAFLALYPEDQRAKVIGYTTLEKYSPEEVEVFVQDDKDAFRDGQKSVVEKISFPNGKIRTMRTSKSRFEFAGHRYILGIAADITEELKLQKALNLSTRDLRMLSNLAMQDLHKPLDKIQRLAYYVREDTEGLLDSTSISQLTEIQDRCVGISQYLTALGSYTKIYNDIEESSEFSMESISSEIMGLINLPASMRLYVSEGDINLPKISLQIVLMQLVNNAIIHSQNTLNAIKITFEDEKFGTVLHVCDTGRGFSKEALARVQKYIEGDAEESFQLLEGKGLAIVSNIVRLYNGNLLVNSDASHGSRVSIFWPN